MIPCLLLYRRGNRDTTPGSIYYLDAPRLGKSQNPQPASKEIGTKCAMPITKTPFQGYYC